MAVATEAGKAAVEGATPLSQNRYKVQLTRVAVKRALLMAATGKIWCGTLSTSELERPVFRYRLGPYGPGAERARVLVPAYA